MGRLFLQRRPAWRDHGLARAAGQGLRFVRRHPFGSLEVVVAVHVCWELLYNPDARVFLRLVGLNALGSLRSLWALLHVDTWGTLASVGRTAGKLLIATLPLFALAWRGRLWERLRLLALPAVYLLFPLMGASSAVLLAAVSGVTLWLVRFRWLRWTALLPLVVMCASVPIHQFGYVWSRSALLRHCAGNAGRRPVNLRNEQVSPSYRGASFLRPDEILLPGSFETAAPGGSGLGGSWWLRRGEAGWQVDAPSKVNFSFWPGCVIGDELWLARPNFMMAVRRDATTGVESVRRIPIPVIVMDFGEVVCLPDEGRVLVTEALTGSGIWEVTAKTGAVRRLAHDIGGLGAVARRWRPGRILATNGSDLIIYSTVREEILDRTPAGVQMFGGLDVCALDDEVAAADLAGRVRFFRLDDQGHYRFKWGLPLSAPRVVLYSPDCRHLVVTSWDDESVWLIDRVARRQIATYRAGPALRGVTWLGPREFAIADACTMSDVVF